MHLSPREQDKLLLHAAGSLAQKRLARGVRLNVTEATALIATVLQELIRDGKHSVADLMSLGKTILGRRHVLPSVPALLHEIMVEGTFLDGTFLKNDRHEPVSSENVESLNLALYGTFFPSPAADLFPSVSEEVDLVPPGAVVVDQSSGPIPINVGRARVKIQVTNKGDRPIQVGSHYHFCEVNRELSFDRYAALFKRLDIAAGTAVRFEPGETKSVILVDIGGKKRITGGNKIATGLKCDASEEEKQKAVQDLAARGFAHVAASITSPSTIEPFEISREVYAKMFGPTTGDRIRLGDTDLWIRVEKDLTVYGDELKFGGGKTVREGMGQTTGLRDLECLDQVITNALIVDWSGIYKADIGISKGYICGIGKAGNPDVMDGVHKDLWVGSTTEVIAGEGMILTAGAIDAHVHYICPQLLPEALASGITTVIGGGTGPVAGTSATTCTPSAQDIQLMFSAMDHIPMNILITGKGNDSEPVGLEDQIRAGCGGMKLHEDWGTTPSTIDNCLTVCDQYDVQCNIHTDTLNESGFVEDTIGAFKGRTIHTYHSEGAGGGHAPDIITVCGQANVLPSSTNPTRPYCKNTLDEHLDMLMVCHHLSRSIPEDIAFAESRIRAETVASEDVLQDNGAISMISSDSQAMGRIGEVISRTWRTAAKMRQFVGPLPEDSESDDNKRVKRYISKYTINPAIVHGISHLVGDIAVGKLADLVLWRPCDFGQRPHHVIKGGFVAWAQMGEANASIPTVQPVIGRPMWACSPSAAPMVSLNFVSAVSIDEGIFELYGLKKLARAVKNCRTISKKDMKHNTALPKITVDPETYVVTADGKHATVGPATELPLTQNYLLF